MLTFKEYLQEKLLAEYSTAVPMPSGNAAQSDWDKWNFNRRNQSPVNSEAST